MVRISNFLVFFLTLAVIYSFNLYLIDLYTHEGKLETAPRRLKVVKHLALLSMALVVISQFTGFYYTFDEMNRYQRAPGFIVCYIITPSELPMPRKPAEAHDHRAVSNAELWEKATDKRHK
jgi:hypothetical protein